MTVNTLVRDALRNVQDTSHTLQQSSSNVYDDSQHIATHYNTYIYVSLHVWRHLSQPLIVRASLRFLAVSPDPAVRVCMCVCVRARALMCVLFAQESLQQSY